MISVAMATYNGAKYLREQIDSVLNQLDLDDELIISDDGSTDDTINIINSYSGDNRVHFYNNPSQVKGVITNFENAINMTTQQIVFLCDQDDVWLPNKISRMCREFVNSEVGLVVSNVKIVDEELKGLQNTYLIDGQCKNGVVRNFIRNTYMGCCMAFRRELKEVVMPFPKNIPMHDSWIGLLAELNGINISYIPEKLMLYRRHSNSVIVSKKTNLFKKINERIFLFYNLFLRQISLQIRARKK